MLQALLVLWNNVGYGGGAVEVEFLSGSEYDQSNIAMTQNWQFIRFLKQSEFASWESDLTTTDIGDAFDGNFLASHDVRLYLLIVAGGYEHALLSAVCFIYPLNKMN